MQEYLKFAPRYVALKFRKDISRYQLPWWKKILYRLRKRPIPMYDYTRFFAENDPYEVLTHDKNLITNEGVQAMWRIFAGLGTSAAPSATNRASFYSSTNAKIGAGDGTAAASQTDTNLTGANKTWAAMDSGYPQAPSFDPSGSRAITYSSTFAAGVGSHAWNEIGLANDNKTTNTYAVLYSRANISWGTKGASDSWTVAIQYSVS